MPDTKEKMFYRTVWGNIEKYRLIKNISKEKLAVSARFSTSSYYKRKSAPEKLSLKELYAIAHLLGVSITDFFQS